MSPQEKKLLDALEGYYGNDPERLRDLVNELVDAGDISYGAANEFLDNLPDLSIFRPGSEYGPGPMRAKTVSEARKQEFKRGEDPHKSLRIGKYKDYEPEDDDDWDPCAPKRRPDPCGYVPPSRSSSGCGSSPSSRSSC